MQKEELFSGLAAPSRGSAGGTPASPPSPLGPYVVNQLPADLAAVARGLCTYEELEARQCRLLDTLGVGRHVDGDAAAAPLVQLDLLFMLNGYLPAGPSAFPGPLLDAVSARCARFPALDPYMSYELLIDVNCAEWQRGGDIRVFSEGRLGLLERDFYLGHRLAEPAARTAFERLCAVLREPDAVDTAAEFEAALSALEDFRAHMARFGRLSREAFRAFRPYHMGYQGGPRGASGAFMPSVQLLELVLLAPSRQYERYLDQSLAYFPAWSRPLISEWRERSGRGDNVVEAVLDGRVKTGRGAAGVLLDLVDGFVDFRMVHLGITRKALPEVFAPDDALTRRDILAQDGEGDVLADGEPGTSGFGVHTVLTNAVYRLLAARRLLAELPDRSPADAGGSHV